MKTSLLAQLTLAALLAAAGCGDDTDGAGGDANGGAAAGAGDVGGQGTGASNAGGAGAGGGASLDWQALMEADWSLEPFSEETSDVHTITVDEDIYIGAIRPIAPPGTHHTLLGINNLNMGNIIYASGVGTNAIIFPEGVGLKLAAGETLVLQLHLFNPSGEPISGKSGIEIVEIAPENVEQEADLYLPGPFDLAIPPNQEFTQTSTCNVQAPMNIFAVFPHMHQLGTHFKTTLVVDGETSVLHDDAYSFSEQAFIQFNPIALSPGDEIITECTWNNTTAGTVGWGESSTTEMCFSILYRYPKITDAGFCAQ